ncbi:MAG: AAA family ATPase, partial [Gemmatimonadaceae bacterium]|nr:AAA family ATPase [Gemmatimonadaceae bacterium]
MREHHLDDRSTTALNGPTLRVLGRLELIAPDGSVLLGPGKPLALLAYLRAQSVRAATRPQLVDLLWADLEPERARANVRQALLVLRRLLPEGSLVSDGDQVVLSDGLATDRDAFVSAVDRGDFAGAIALYRGDFIPDVAVPGGAEFEMWCDIERRHLGALFARVLETAVRDSLAGGRSAEALQLARRLRDLDPSRERAWRLLIESEVAAEGLASARLEAERLVEMLRVDGRPLEPATSQLLHRLRDTARPTPRMDGALGAPEFVGREAQLARVLSAWGTAKRGRRVHLHVEALAGTGKTRLLDESCARLQATGARVVRCGSRRDERDVPFALAASVVTALATLPGAIAVAPSSMSALVAMAPDASAIFSSAADASTGEEAMRRRAVAIADLLGAVTHESALAIAVDDLHWADAASLQLLTLAKGRVATEARLVLLTAGRDPLAAQSDAERVALPPLSSQQVDSLLQSLAGAGDPSWWATFVNALQNASDGVPFYALQMVHAAVEKRLLRVVDDTWTAPDVPGLLAALDAREAARLRLAQLSVGEQQLLRLLSCGLPVVEDVLATSARMPSSDVEPALARLELRGQVRRLATGEWTVAHDEISELVRAQTDGDELRAVRRSLALAVAAEDAMPVATLRQVIALLAAAEADADVGSVVREWVRRGALPPVGVHVADLVPLGLSEARTAAIRRALRRALPLPPSRSRRLFVGLSGAVGALFFVGYLLTRPAELFFVQEPISTNACEIADRPAIV